MSVLRIDKDKNPVRVALENKSKDGHTNYVALFFDNSFYVIRYPYSPVAPSDAMSNIKSKTFDVFCFSYNSVSGMAVASTGIPDDSKVICNNCLFISLPEGKDLEFALLTNIHNALYDILNLYNTTK